MRRTLVTSPTLLVTLSLMVVALVAATVGCRSEPPAREFDAKNVVEAGNMAIEHGQKMQELGARMVEHGQVVNDQSWIADGQHWVVDGKRMVEAGQSAVRLGQSMRGNPIKAREVDIDQLRVQGQGLILDGQTFVEHGKIMVELTEVLKRRAENSGDQRLAQDVADSADRAKLMGQSGEQLVQGGQQLIDFASGMAKSIGR